MNYPDEFEQAYKDYVSQSPWHDSRGDKLAFYTFYLHGVASTKDKEIKALKQAQNAVMEGWNETTRKN